MKGDVELDASGRGRSGNQSHASTKHTIRSRVRDAEVDSQESILRDENVTVHSRGHERDGHIVRTDVVTVTYGKERNDPRRTVPGDQQTSWARM